MVLITHELESIFRIADRVIMQRNQAVGGAYKLDIAPAVGQLVSHDLGNRQFCNRFEHGFLQALCQGRTLDGAVVKQRLGLAVGCALEAGHRRCVGAQGLQLLEQRGRGIARCVQPHGHRHEFLRDSLVGSLRGHCRDMRSQAARRGKGGERRSLGRQALGLELLEQHTGKGIAQLFKRLGRQLFDKQFYEKVLGGVHLFFRKCRSAKIDRATAISGTQMVWTSLSSTSAPRCVKNREKATGETSTGRHGLKKRCSENGQ